MKRNTKKFTPNELVFLKRRNNILQKIKGDLLSGVSEQDNVYFVHGYYCEVGKETLAECDYILPFSAVMQKDNFYATQFHLEKSATVGEKILLNFLKN